MATASAPSPAPSCSRCGSTGTWYASSSQWGCDKCQMLPMQQGAPLAATPWNGANPYGPSAANPHSQAPVGAYTPPAVSCPRCGNFATFYAQTNQYGCDRCQMPVSAPLLPNHYAPVASSGSDTGMVVAKVIGTIVLIIALIAIKVAIRSM